MSSEMETRVKYLENIVNTLIKDRNMSDKNKNQKPGGSNLPPDADPNQQPPADQQPATSAIKLKLPKYDMNYNGNLIRVTAEVLEGNDDLHAYARKNFPEIFE